MNDIHDRGRAMAARMLAPRSRGGKGLEIVLSVISQAGKYHPGTGGAAHAQTDHHGSALRVEYEQRDIDGTTIKSSDVRLLVSPLALDGSPLPKPATQNRITFDGITYTVERCSAWNFAGVDCGYEVQGRPL